MGSNGDAKQEMLTSKVLTKWVVGMCDQPDHLVDFDRIDSAE